MDACVWYYSTQFGSSVLPNRVATQIFAKPTLTFEKKVQKDIVVKLQSRVTIHLWWLLAWFVFIGMPFKAQFDESRAPIFTPEVTVQRNSFDASADAELAHAMQQSMSLSDTSARGRAPSYSQYSSDDILPTAEAAVEMLASALDSVTTPEEMKNNDIIQDIVQQCEQLKAPLASVIERSLSENSPVIAVES